MVAPDGPEIFSRDIQSTIGIASGIIAFSVAMGALIAVAYLVLHGRFTLRPSRLAWLIAGLGFLGVYLLPFVKYPANPPAIGHTFTIGHPRPAVPGAGGLLADPARPGRLPGSQAARRGSAG